MAKALLGTHTTPRSIELLDEIRSLRRRVTELEQALARAESAREARAESAREAREEAPELVVELADRDSETVSS